MDTNDEIAVEDHRFFRERLNHLQYRHPAMLLALLEERQLTLHLREVTAWAMRTLGELTMNQGLATNQAEELVLRLIVADPSEQSKVRDPVNRQRLRRLIRRYQESLPRLTRTYLSQNEITE